MTVVTTAMVKEIRRLRRFGLTLEKIGRRVGVSRCTASKYLSEENEQAIRRRDARRWQHIKSDPVKLEKKRAAVREWKKCKGL